jgi:hypothetical protein
MQPLAWQLMVLHDFISSLLRPGQDAPPNNGASSTSRDLKVSPPPHSALHAVQVDHDDHLQFTGAGHAVGAEHGAISIIGSWQPLPKIPRMLVN